MLRDKVTLITGASRGIGRATALLFAENHAKVIVNYLQNEKEAQDIVDHITKNGYHAIKIKADISKEEEVKNMFKIVKEIYGRLDILVNNAGIMINNLLMLTNSLEFDRTIGVNCKGTFLCTQHAVKMMIKQNSGKIINISSIAGTNGNHGQTVYSGSKSFIIGFTKSAAKELGRYGITVNAIAPGLINTDLIKNIKKDVVDEAISRNALGRIGKPEDVAKAILFLGSDMGGYISGQVIGVDGCQIM